MWLFDEICREELPLTDGHYDPKCLGIRPVKMRAWWCNASQTRIDLTTNQWTCDSVPSCRSHSTIYGRDIGSDSLSQCMQTHRSALSISWCLLWWALVKESVLVGVFFERVQAKNSGQCTARTWNPWQHSSPAMVLWNCGGALANRLRRRTSDQTVLGSNPAVAAALSPWTMALYSHCPKEKPSH